MALTKYFWTRSEQDQTRWCLSYLYYPDAPQVSAGRPGGCACRPHAHARIRSPRSPLATSHFTCPAFYLNICPYYYSIFHSIASHSRCHFLPEQAFNYERRPSVYLPDSLCNRSVRFLRQCFDLALASSAKNWS